MEIKIIKEKINKEELKNIAKQGYITLVKIAVDIEKEIITMGAEWHVECQEVLIKNGSNAEDIWGANIMLGIPKEKRLMFHSLINIRPNFGHQEMEIQDKEVREKITRIVNKLVE